MANVNLDAIRKKIEQLSGNKAKSFDNKVKFYNPDFGEHTVRILPWKDAAEGMPFKERYVYDGFGKMCVSLRQFGKPDPMGDYVHSLFTAGTDEAKAQGKKLAAKLKTFVAVIDRNRESEGPMLWVLSRDLAKDILGHWVDDEYGDISDLEAGYDLKVNVSKSAKIFNGKPAKDIKTKPRKNPSKAHSDPEVVKKWMDNLPDIDAVYRIRTTEEVQNQLTEWLTKKDKDPSNTEEVRGEPTEDENETAEAVEETIKEVAPKPVPAPKKPKAAPKTANVEETMHALDDQLATLDELMG